MAKTSSKPASRSNGSALGFEEKLWGMADKTRGNLDAAGYKHVEVGLIFLKYISDAYAERHTALRDALLPKLLPGKLRVLAAAESLEAST